MRIFTFKYDKNPLRSAMSEMKKVIQTEVPHIKEDEMICDSSEIMNKIMSPARLDLFVTIVEQQPGSLYELAQILGKDQSQVLKDSKTLESLGLIELVEVSGEGRAKLRPKALYDKIVFEVEPKSIAKSA